MAMMLFLHTQERVWALEAGLGHPGVSKEGLTSLPLLDARSLEAGSLELEVEARRTRIRFFLSEGQVLEFLACFFLKESFLWCFCVRFGLWKWGWVA